MAFQMIHMEIAYGLLQHLPQIENKAEFLLGSVAPDSVHMNPNYDVSSKVLSHMFEGCGMWSDTQDYERWMSNIQEVFVKLTAQEDDSKYRDFVIGLCVHCMTDYWNDLRIWRRLQKQNMPPMTLEEFKEAYYPEAKGIDLWLYQNSANTKVIRELLREADSFDVEGLVKKAEVEKQRQHLLCVQYEADEIDISQFRFLSAEDIRDFVTFVVEDIAGKIREWEKETR